MNSTHRILSEVVEPIMAQNVRMLAQDEATAHTARNSTHSTQLLKSADTDSTELVENFQTIFSWIPK